MINEEIDDHFSQSVKSVQILGGMIWQSTLCLKDCISFNNHRCEQRVGLLIIKTFLSMKCYAKFFIIIKTLKQSEFYKLHVWLRYGTSVQWNAMLFIMIIFKNIYMGNSNNIKVN